MDVFHESNTIHKIALITVGKVLKQSLSNSFYAFGTV